MTADQFDRPLAGITVVSLEQAVSAPYATRHLADLGARVIKVERPGAGDFARRYDESVRGLSSYFVWANRSKESLTLDLKAPEGQRILGALVDQADVFVQNLAPGAVERLGLGAEPLRRSHPRLVICELAGYGADGPWAGRKAYDLLVQAEVGLLALTGSSEATARVGVSIADISAGMYAFAGVLAALLQRERTGQGTIVRTSLFDALAEWAGQPAYYTQYAGSSPPRTGTHHPTIAPYGPFRCRDGESVVVAVQNDREWAAFCREFVGEAALADDPRFVDNPARVANRVALHELVGRAVGALDSAAALARLDAIGIANARERSMTDLLDHPQVTGRERWREFGSPVGPLRGPIWPVDLEGVEPRMDPVPAVGEHTDAILAELGYAADERAELRQQGVV